MRPVVVVGDLMVDVVARMAEPLRAGSDTAARVVSRPGGSAANVAAWLAESGVPVTLVARIGDDAAGWLAVERLRGAGVTARVAADEALSTGTCVVLVGVDGERSMLPDPGANAALSAADLPQAAFAGGAHLHVSGYALLRDGAPREAAVAALGRARAAGMTVSVDPSSAAPLAALGPERFLALAAHPDVLLPNAVEAAALTGEDDAAAAARALSAHAREVVVTLGADGALWTDGRVTLTAAAAAVDAANGVDTTGAGDAFAAGFLAAWLDGAAPGAALASGAHLAGRALAIEGARAV